MLDLSPTRRIATRLPFLKSKLVSLGTCSTAQGSTAQGQPWHMTHEQYVTQLMTQHMTQHYDTPPSLSQQLITSVSTAAEI